MLQNLILFLFCACTLVMAKTSANQALNLPASTKLLDDKTPLQNGESFVYSVLEDADAPISLYIGGDGRADFPLIGPQIAMGVTPFDLANKIKSRLEKEFYYQATVIIVRPSELAGAIEPDTTARVTVSGQVQTPGVYTIASGSFTVSQAVLSAGGPAKYANASKVKLMRQDPKTNSTQTLIMDLKKVLEEGRHDLDPIVRPDDIICVPEKLINF